MLTIKILSGLAFIGSVASFIAAWLGDRKMKRQANQNQIVAKNGLGIQAGGDVNTGSIHVSRKTIDAE